MKNNNYSHRSSVKFFFALMIILSSFLPAKALVSSYTFSSSTTNYTAITGTTLFSGTWDDGVSSLLTIPFTFTYNGTAYTSLGVSTNGYITMGAVPASSTVYCGLQGAGANSIAGYGTDMVGASATSTIIYGTRGTTPNRQFVVQWTDCDHWNANANHWTFQIILNETSNTVQVVWGTSTDATTMGANSCQDVSTESGDIGLLGSSQNDFNIRSIINGTNTWSSSVAGTVLSDVCNMSSSNIPATGLTYTWTPGALVAMSYSSSTTVFLNNGAAVARNSTGDQILQVQVVTTGTSSPFNVTSLSLSTTGSTNPSTDISNAKIYFTGISNSFSASSQFGSTVNSPNGSYTVTGSATLSEGTNYFWITYDITGTAGFGNTLSGCCTQIIGSGTMGTRTPTVTCPSGSQTISQIGIWTAVATTAPHANGGGMLLLSDGTVLCKSTGGGADGYGNIYDKLTPDIHGSYVNGTWSSISSMINTRLFYSSQVLKDGRVYVAGGEYGSGGGAGEVYDPLTNIWTLTSNNPSGFVSDANSEILENGKVLQALVAGSLTGTNIYNPATNSYSSGPTALGIHNESAWIKLPDNSVLYVDRLSTNSERYIPASNTWVADGTIPVSLYDPYGDETGGALLLPDGRAFFLGAPGHTAYYTPSGNSSPGTWAAGPDIPGAQGTPDAPMAMMVNGKILCTVSPVPTSANHFPSPTKFYEFDYITNTFTQIGVPGGGTSLPVSCYVTNFLDLPDGTVLYSIQQNANASQYYVYTPVGNPVTSGKPTISNISQISCTAFKITGTKFNGISQGASYGDDWQMASNYPLVRLTSGTNVYYARTFNWNSTGVMRGSLPDTAQFTIPSGLPSGTYSLVVVANGISSDPVSFNANPSLSSTLTPSSVCSGTAFTYTPASATSNATFTWTRAAVAGISNAAVTVPQSTNPNEVLINTTSNPVSVIYAYTITAGTCSNTQNVTVVVNPAPTASVISAGGPTSFCQGGSVTLSGNTTSGIWSIVGGTASSITATTAGDYFVTTTNSCGSTTSNHITVTVNSLPTASVISAGGPTSFCQGGSVTLSGNTTGGIWSVVGGSAASISASSAGDYFVTTTNSCGSTTSNHITVTVNSLPTASVISAGGPTSFCQGGSVTLSGNTTGGIWSVVGGSAASISASSGGDYFVTTTNSCGSTTSNHITVTVNPSPSAVVTGSTVYCGNTNGTVTNVVSGGTAPYTYLWSTGASTQNISSLAAGNYSVTITDLNGCLFSDAAAVINGGTALSVTLNSSSATCGQSNGAVTNTINGGTSPFIFAWSNGATTQNLSNVPAGNYAVTVTDAFGCQSNSSATVSSTGNAPAQPTFSTTQLYVCRSQTGFVYSVLAVNGATSYLWTTSNGATISSGQGTTSVTVSFSASATSSTITCAAVNGCGNSTAASFAYTIATAKPAVPGTMSGNTINCANTTATFSVPVVAYATTYTWTIPANTTIISGQGTNSISLSFGAAWVGGTVSVNASNCIGTSANRSKAIRGIPATPASITGPISGICNATGVGYSTAAVSYASSYTWTVPSGVTIASGQGTTAITVDFNASFLTGAISVTADNSCGASAARTVTVKSAPATPGTITGLLNNICLAGNQTYSIAPVFGATSYTWTVPTGTTIISGQGTTSVLLSFPSGFLVGNISVYASNTCANSASKTITVYARPATPGTITGTNPVCANQAGVNYSVAAVTGATSYTWTVPTGATIASGQGTIAVSVNFGSTAGNVTVKAANSCASSPVKSLTITMNCRLDESVIETDFSVYPNPTDGLFTVEISNPENFTTLKIENILGQTMLTKNMDGESSIHIQFPNEVAKGVYIIHLIGENAIVSKQIVLQ